MNYTGKKLKEFSFVNPSNGYIASVRCHLPVVNATESAMEMSSGILWVNCEGQIFFSKMADAGEINGIN